MRLGRPNFGRTVVPFTKKIVKELEIQADHDGVSLVLSA